MNFLLTGDYSKVSNIALFSFKAPLKVFEAGTMPQPCYLCDHRTALSCLYCLDLKDNQTCFDLPAIIRLAGTCFFSLAFLAFLPNIHCFTFYQLDIFSHKLLFRSKKLAINVI